MTKIIFFSNTAWYLFNYRLDFLRHIRERGYLPVLVVTHDAYVEKLRAEGFTVYPLSLDRRGMNPIRELITIFQLTRIYKREAPAIVHHFTVKCVIYGTVAAFFAGVPSAVNSITGLGHLFLSTHLKIRVIRFFLFPLYRTLSSFCRVHFLFQNPEDEKIFWFWKIARADNSTLILGSGVNLALYRESAVQRTSVRILFASRILKEKGVEELIEAVRTLKQKKLSFELRLAGQIDSGNPSTLQEAAVQEWQREGLITYLGHQESVVEEVNAADIIILPSWREGLPKILIEGAAASKPLIATDVPGCKDVVDHEVNGILVPLRDSVALAQAMGRLILDEGLRQKMGRAARKKAEAIFDQQINFKKTMAVYSQVLRQS